MALTGVHIAPWGRDTQYDPGLARRLAAVGFTPGAPRGSWSFLGEADALNTALGEARLAGVLLIELGRQEKDLEQVLAESWRDGAGPGPRRAA
jgi:hypothetical protein